MRDWQEGRDKRGTKGTEEQRVRANKPQKGLLGRRTSSEAQFGGWEGGSVYTHPLKHMTDRPGPCVSHMPGCISCKRHQYLSHFPFQRRKPPITPEDGKIIRDKSNYPTFCFCFMYNSSPALRRGRQILLHIEIQVQATVVHVRTDCIAELESYLQW